MLLSGHQHPSIAKSSISNQLALDPMPMISAIRLYRIFLSSLNYFWHRHVKKFSEPFKELVHTECLWRFKEPVSPHLAARMAMEESNNKVKLFHPFDCCYLLKQVLQASIPSDETFVNAIACHISKCASELTGPGNMFIETSGGEDSLYL